MGPGSERKYDTYAYRFVTQFNCYKHFFGQPSYCRTPLLVSLLQELIRRKGLKRALAGRDEDGLVPILEFITRY